MIYQIGLTMIDGVGDILARHLLEALGDAETIFTEKKRLLEKVPGIGGVLSAQIKRPEVLQKAEKELDFIVENQIQTYFLTDENYPHRLKECADAPVLFYYKGNGSLSGSRIISIVGTRNATDYGRELTDKLVDELSVLLPDTLIVSGLAYGIDISAHRAALKYGLPTVGVLAHGLDRIYPQTHRSTAVEMLQQGGLLTDFPSATNPDKQNFVKRNRIVAGLADATVVVQSAEKGGSLITADMAFSYGRDVFAFPGRVNDTSSAGCNNLIRKNKAALITHATDLIEAMSWDIEKTQESPLQTQLFFPANSTEEKIITLLQQEEELHINQLALALELPVSQLSLTLFEMEINHLLKTRPGNMYRLYER
ncbi:DNA-processing protein DprA [Parabacteroides sp. PF5-9]|uniref:DNA-processing protein DprA n=1 Tax=Parabacteroides sp. PF5-9 TaxID=1742404 RepID=UPI00247484A5|nr:DNA-processing protein DprA [Parabacteroides sp. PF5-9]MDH6356347.1 DNA processing protein [Parabacteroides sp. PF5-9]